MRTDDPKQRASVVVIDDDDALVQVCRIQMRQHRTFSFEAYATTAREGLELVTKVRPAIALVDLRLPDADGRSILPHLAVRCPETMVAALSVSDAEQAEADVLATGAFAYYEKSMLLGGRLLQYLAQDLALFRRALDGEDVVAPSALARRHPVGVTPELEEGLRAG